VNRATTWFSKVTFTPHDHHVFTGRYIYANTNQNEMDGIALRPEWLSHAAPITQVFGLDWTWTPNSRGSTLLAFSFNSFLGEDRALDANVNPLTTGLNTGITDSPLFGFPTGLNPGSDWFDYWGASGLGLLDVAESERSTIRTPFRHTKGRHRHSIWW
jgi:hypothetical protein